MLIATVTRYAYSLCLVGARATAYLSSVYYLSEAPCEAEFTEALNKYSKWYANIIYRIKINRLSVFITYSASSA